MSSEGPREIRPRLAICVSLSACSQPSEGGWFPNRGRGGGTGEVGARQEIDWSLGKDTEAMKQSHCTFQSEPPTSVHYQ